MTGGVTGGATAGGPPLARLFAIAYRQLIDGLHERLRELGWTDVREAFGFVLLAARDQPTSITELAALMGVTKQAASKLVDVMAGCGYVSRGADPHDGRQRPVALTGRGRDLLAAVEQIYAELEGRWAEVIGAGQVDGMRRDLLRMLSSDRLGDGIGAGRLPPVRPPS
ncbi:MAG TPA: MarR family transcriptional regulator [Streptosporangiaceae bacterium]